MRDIYVSIIVPIYNSERYLNRCIDSLINQSIKEIEIILINDGSTDRSSELIEEYSRKDNRIKVINKVNGGVSTARNAGIECALGKYISFVDSDDWCEVDMFEKMYKSALEMDVDFINIGFSMDNKSGKSIIINKSNKNIISKDTKEIAKVLSELTLGYSVMKLFRRDIILKNKIRFTNNLMLGEDAIFVQEYIKFINSVAVVDSASYHYVRCNNESLSTRYIDNISEFVETFWEKEEEVIMKFPEYRNFRKNKGFTKNINGTIFYIINNYKKGSPLNSKQRRDFINRKMENDMIYEEIKTFKPNKFSDKIFVNLFKLKSPMIMDLVYSSRRTIIKISSLITGIQK